MRIEPIWKLIWSNKAMLPILWELFPGHPNLLWAGAQPPASGDYVRKPVLAREGANVTLVQGGVVAGATGGRYGDGPTVCQAAYRLRAFDGRYPVIGAWVVGGQAAGMGVREGALLITDNSSLASPRT